MTDFSASFGKPFAHQVAAWRIRLANQVTTAVWDEMMHSAHDRAFTVAGAMKAELLADLAEAVDKAITGGGTLESFRKDFRAIVERNGWHGWAGEGTKKGEAWRTKVIYKTNLATTYAAGRLAQLREAGFAFFVYRHGNSVEPRVQHLAWDGLVLEADHPFWATHAPPNGWGCSCYITGARTREGARRVGGKPDKQLEDGWDRLDPKTGVPVGIDKGWAYAPGETVTDAVTEAVRDKLARLPPAIAADLAKDVGGTDGAFTPSEMKAILEDIFDPHWLHDIEAGALAAAKGPVGHADAMAIRAFSIPYYDGYGTLNEALRHVGGAKPSPAQAAWIKALDRAVEKLPPYRGVVHRGLDVRPGPSLDQFMRLEQGQAVKFRGYSSTSAEADRALAGNVVLRINSLTGRRLDDLAAMVDEREVLLRRDTTYIVQRREIEDDTVTIWLDEVEAPPAGLRVELMHDLSVG